MHRTSISHRTLLTFVILKSSIGDVATPFGTTTGPVNTTIVTGSGPERGRPKPSPVEGKFMNATLIVVHTVH